MGIYLYIFYKFIYFFFNKNINVRWMEKEKNGKIRKKLVKINNCIMMNKINL